MDAGEFFAAAVVAFEVAGVAVMVLGAALAVVLGAVSIVRDRSATLALQRLRRALGGAILLGLEILVAADIVKTVTSRLAIEDVLALGLIVVIRIVLSFSIQIEVEGSLPWRRALTESGAAHVRRAVRDTATTRDRSTPAKDGG